MLKRLIEYVYGLYLIIRLDQLIQASGNDDQKIFHFFSGMPRETLDNLVSIVKGNKYFEGKRVKTAVLLVHSFHKVCDLAEQR